MTPQGSHSDHPDIVAALRQGDPEAMKCLYTEYAPVLAAVCCRYLGDATYTSDLLHDAFIKAFTSIDRFEWRGIGSLKAWLTRITVNECLRHLREAERLEMVDSDNGFPELPDAPPPHTDDIDADTLLDMVGKLPAGYRAVFNMYVVDRMTHREIASALNITESTSASQLHKAKAMLARQINNYKALNND